MSPRASFPCLIGLVLLLAACGEEKVAVYSVPKEKDPEPPMAAAADAGAAAPAGGTMATTAVPTASGDSLVWTAPASWTAKAPGAMRKGSYGVSAAGGEADLSITAFPGDVGGELANVNRWRGQVGLPSLAPGDLEASVSRFDSNSLSFTVVALSPAGGKSILGAIVPYNGSTWFFKLTGPAAAVDASKADFMAFLRTIKAP